MSKPRITVHISDNFIVECYVNFKKPRCHTHTLTYRKYRSIDSERLSRDLLSATQNDDTITDFNRSVQSVLDAHEPLTSRVVTERNHQPWNNRSITEAKRRLCRLERKQSGQFKRERNTYGNLLYKTRANYYKNAIGETKDNSKALYRITNILLDNTRNIVLPDCDDIVLLAEKFQVYFSSKVERVKGKLRKITVNNINLLKNTLPLITKIYVRNIVKSLKYKSCLLDPLPAFILKYHVVQLAPSICWLLNISMSTATVPVEMKSSVVTPIYKKKTTGCELSL